MVARKGQPNLANDPLFRPDWKERAKQHGPDETRRWFAFRTTGAFILLFSKAAKRRGMSNSAYLRRAVSAFVASDLQMPFEDVCAAHPAVEGVLKKTPNEWVSVVDDGQGYGNWEVKE